MSLTITFGEAFEADPEGMNTDNIRVYRYHGRTYIGESTSENVHVCDDTCLAQALPREYMLCTGADDRYISIHPWAKGTTHQGEPMMYVRTADVGDFDPGDDPYVLCESCKTELRRDDERFEAEYGHPIGETVRITVLARITTAAIDEAENDPMEEALAWAVTDGINRKLVADVRLHEFRVFTDWPTTTDIYDRDDPIGVP